MATNVTLLQSTIDALPAPTEVFDWPVEAVREGNWAEAARRWAVLRRVYPRQVDTWIQGAIAHMAVGELELAEALLIHARKRFPNHPLAVTESAELAMRRGQWDVADALLSEARERFPRFLHSWTKSAECAEAKGEPLQASAFNNEARQRFPDKPGPFIQYAEMAMSAERWDQALTRWAEVRARFPQLAPAYLRAAEAARRLNRHKDARQLALACHYGGDVFDEEIEPRVAAKPLEKRLRIRWFLELIWVKAIFNLRSEVHRNYLSYGWWVIEPLLHMTVYYMVFGLLLQRGGGDFPSFLLAGLIPWMWFSKAVSSSSNSILCGHQLMLQVGLPATVFPLVSLLQTTLRQLPVFVLFLGFLWAHGYSPGSHWWALLPVAAVQLLFTIAFSCAVAAVIPFVRDVSYLVPTGLTLLMFLSGIFYDYRTISEEWQAAFLFNPVAFLLSCYRRIFIEGGVPDLQILAWWGGASAVACLLLLVAYRRLRYVYPRIVLE